MNNIAAVPERDAHLDDLAAQVAATVQLKDIRLEKCSCRNEATGDNLPDEIRHTFLPRHELVDSNRLAAHIMFGLDVCHADSSAPSGAIQVEATFAVVYDLPDGHGFQEEHVRAFVERNAVFNAWPYWREFLQSMTVRMGLPALTLPVFRIAPKRSEGPTGSQV